MWMKSHEAAIFTGETFSERKIKALIKKSFSQPWKHFTEKTTSYEKQLL